MSSTPNEPATPQQPGQNPTPAAPQFGAPQQGAPQYGAAPSGPPQFGGQQQFGAPPAYGTQPGQSYPGTPQWPGESPYQGAPAPVGRPRKVEISFWLIIAAGVLNLLSAVLSAALIADTAQFRDLVRQMEQSGSDAPSADSLKSLVTVMVLVIGAIQLGLYLLVAFFVRKGANWARILGTVFAALSLFGLVGGNAMSIIVTLLGVAAIVLLYLKDTSPYFAKRPKF